MTANAQAKLLDVIAKCWTDEDYKKKLLADPRSVLAQDGIEVPAEATIRVVDQQPHEWYLFIPPRPKAEINVRNVTSQVATSAGLTLSQASHTAGMTVASGGAGASHHTTGMTFAMTFQSCDPRTAGMTTAMTFQSCDPRTAGMTTAMTFQSCDPRTAGMTTAMTFQSCDPRTAPLTLLTIPPAAPGSGKTGGGSGSEGGGQ